MWKFAGVRSRDLDSHLVGVPREMSRPPPRSAPGATRRSQWLHERGHHSAAATAVWVRLEVLYEDPLLCGTTAYCTLILARGVGGTCLDWVFLASVQIVWIFSAVLIHFFLPENNFWRLLTLPVPTLIYS